MKRPHGEYANVLLVGASVLFYARGGGAFTWLMLASITFNYLMAIAVAAGLEGPPDKHARSRALAGRGHRRQSRRARRVQVRELLRRQRERDAGVAERRAVCRPPGAAADRHLVLHVPCDLVRGRRLPRPRDRPEEPDPRRALSAAVPAAHRRADHPLPRDRRPARPPRRRPRRLRRGRPPLHRRARQEGPDCEQRRDRRRRHLRAARPRS